VVDLSARGLVVQDLPLPPHFVTAYSQDFPGLLELMHLYHIAAPEDDVAASCVDFESCPGAYGKLNRSCFGKDLVDDEILASWLQCVE